jgi:hypothetical protein
MAKKVKTKKIDWKTLVEKAEGTTRRQKELIYEFSNGRRFYEPFDPSGRGIYE